MLDGDLVTTLYRAYLLVCIFAGGVVIGWGIGVGLCAVYDLIKKRLTK